MLAVLHRLFDGMRKGDSTMIRSVFLPGATLTTATLRANQQVQTVGAIDPFIASVGVPRAEALDERLRNEIVHIDGPLATVWTDYTLYVGSRMSHCGVDVAVLVRTANGWKIASLADSGRRRLGRPPRRAGQGVIFQNAMPPAVSDVHGRDDRARLQVHDVHLARRGADALAADERVARVGTHRDAVGHRRGGLRPEDARAVARVEQLDHAALLQRRHERPAIRVTPRL